MASDEQVRRVVDYLAERREAMVELLRRLALAESPTDVPASQDAVMETLAGELAASGCDVRRLPGRRTGGQLYARRRGVRPGQPFQLLLGHTDTVWPLGTLDDMPVTVNEGRILGPGVYDMKGGLVQIVFSLRALADLDLVPDVGPVAFINSDEELGSGESRRQIERLARRACRALVLEPALGPAGKIKTARKGVGKFIITVKGEPAHAGLEPGKGSSAILELSYLIQDLHALSDAERGVSVNVGVIDGGLRPNMVAPESRAVVDVRVASLEDAGRIEAAVHALQPHIDGAVLEIEGRVGRPPMERTPRNRALWRTAHQVGRQLGLDLQEVTAGGGSDGNITSRYTATLDGLGPVGDGAHARHEHVVIDSLVERTALLALLLLSPCEPLR